MVDANAKRERVEESVSRSVSGMCIRCKLLKYECLVSLSGGYSAIRDIRLLELSGLETDFCMSVRVSGRRHDDYSVIKRLVRQGEIDVELVSSEWGRGKLAQTPFKEKQNFDDINFMGRKKENV